MNESGSSGEPNGRSPSEREPAGQERAEPSPAEQEPSGQGAARQGTPGAGLGPPPLPSLPARMLAVVIEPGPLFEKLRERPVWAAPTFVSAAIVAASLMVIPGDVWDAWFRTQQLRSGQPLPDGIDMGRILRVGGSLAALVFSFVWAFLQAGFLAVVFSFLLGDEGRYRQYLSVVGHAFVIGALGAVVALPLKIIQGDPQLTLNLSLFAVGLESGSYPFRVLRLLELFQLWSYAVIAVGVSKIDPRRSLGSALTVMAVFAVVLAMLFGLAPSPA